MSELELPSAQFVPRPCTSVSDIEHGYRLLLGCEPETPAVAAKAARQLFSLAVAAILASSEFETMIAVRGNMLIVSEIMLERLDPDLLAWAAAIVPTALHDGEPIDRLTVIHSLLQDDEIRRYAVMHGYAAGLLETELTRYRTDARTIATSTLFDAEHYVRQLRSDERIADPAMHYLLFGEARGLTASTTFDAGVYRRLHPDVADNDVNALLHYEKFGRHERRAHRHWLDDHILPPVANDTERPTILLLLHEATYTGAPILGWNLVRALSEQCQVVVVLHCGGALEPAFRNVAAAIIAPPPPHTLADAVEMKRFARRLIETYRPLYVLANSVESRPIATALGNRGAPVVALVHEFWPGATPGARLDFYAASDALVFPARVVEASSLRAFCEAGLQRRFILPQGRCTVPQLGHVVGQGSFPPPFIVANDYALSLDALLADGERGTGPFTIIGLGAVEARKGIDLFMAAAVGIRAKHPDIAVRFVWLGSWEHAIGSQHGALLAEQYDRSALSDALRFFPAVDDLAPVYARADALLLSSRLDPLPNVAIDAACLGIPVVCFDRASGMAELLAADPGTADLVVPYLDTGAAADRIAALALDPALHRSRSEAIRELAHRTFDMTAYADKLDAIGRTAARKVANIDNDARLIRDARAFEPSLYFPQDELAARADADAVAYLHDTRHINFASAAVPGAIRRRPKAGFHPFIYGAEAPNFPPDGSRDPLAHYVESGMPEGRWAHRVLRPKPIEDTAFEDTAPPSPLVALHGHFQYPDDIDAFIRALAANRLHADLFLTTISAASADILRAAVADYESGKTRVDVVPDSGQAIFPFLHVLKMHVRETYEVVGHLHDKRTGQVPAIDSHHGAQWPHFLWEHMLGPGHAMADLIVDAMARDATLGLVFPENGFLSGWERNDVSAGALAQRLGLTGSLPSHIEFPAGMMFWARVEALDTLSRADLRADEMPIEPLPTDGTLLHALERMLPLLCEAAGYRYATAHVAQFCR